jgi:hypothetical protein
VRTQPVHTLYVQCMLLRIYCSVNNWLGDLVAIMLRRRNLAARGKQKGRISLQATRRCQ